MYLRKIEHRFRVFVHTYNRTYLYSHLNIGRNYENFERDNYPIELFRLPIGLSIDLHVFVKMLNIARTKALSSNFDHYTHLNV
jgi:hypothetical protein